jgi:hypothetical protein
VPYLDADENPIVTKPAEDTSVSSLIADGTFGYKLVGDNIDFIINARFMRCDGRQNQSLHYFHCYAILDRIDFSKLPFKSPVANLLVTPSNLQLMASKLLPSDIDDKAMAKNAAILLSRLLYLSSSVPFRMLSHGIFTTSTTRK